MDSIQNKESAMNVTSVLPPPCPNSYEAQERFQNDPSVHVALLSITACNMGLNLTSAAIAVFAELHWVPGTVFQVGRRSSLHTFWLLTYVLAELTFGFSSGPRFLKVVS